MKTKIKSLRSLAIAGFIVLCLGVHAEGNSTKAASKSALIVEPALKVETWMTDESNWKMNETEQALTIESWMTDANNFELESVVEEAIEIENWMIDPEVWTITSANEITEQEPSMMLKAWMTDSKKWETNRK